MDGKTGYITTTYKMRVYCDSPECFYETKDYYNKILSFYYYLLLDMPEFLEYSNQQLLRRLELLTIGARDAAKDEIPYPLPYDKVPLYFRRAAINDAIRLNRSFASKREDGAKPAKSFHASPVYYKGMYREFHGGEIQLKLWNGEKWVWKNCYLDSCGRKLPEQDEGRLLSPTIKLEGNRAMLHIPVRESVPDIRPIRERIQRTEKICAVSFPNRDCLAVMAVMDRSGKCMETCFIRGGNELSRRKKMIVNRIRKNRESMGASVHELPEDENRLYKKKIRNLTENYTHKTSRQITDFCVKRQIKILAVPNYKIGMDRNAKGYLFASGYDWLGRRIIRYLNYKAFKEGILVTAVSAEGITVKCHICGETVKKYNKDNKPGIKYYGGKNYICPNGHQGNSYLNAAMNVGERFLKSQTETRG